jgi:hypothetical protein
MAATRFLDPNDYCLDEGFRHTASVTRLQSICMHLSTYIYISLNYRSGCGILRVVTHDHLLDHKDMQWQTCKYPKPTMASYIGNE